MSALFARDALRDDRRGAMMLSAVFLSAFLVGALWYLIGIGDALVYRETMQDGADATAYASAVYHARGMNVIAMLNIIMAAVLAVLVALKIAQVILLTINAVSCALAWTGAGAVLCAATSAAEGPLEDAIENAQTVVDQVLKGLNIAATGVAVGMPWVAEGMAVAAASENAPTVHGGMAVSASLVPGVDLGLSSSSSASASASTAALSGASGTGGTRLGLPVQEDDFSVLCDHAGEDIASLVLAPFSALGVPTSAASKYVGSGIGSSASYFCGDGTGETSKRVYDDAQNGDDYFGNWSFVWGDLSSQTGAAKGVAIGAWKQVQPTAPSDLSKIGFTKTEFYYDVRPNGGTPAKWSDYKDDAMWNLRWRARFRRVRPPGGQLGSLVSSAVGGQASSYLGSWLGDASSASSALSFVGSWPSNMASSVDASVSQAVGSVDQALGFFTVVH